MKYTLHAPQVQPTTSKTKYAYSSDVIAELRERNSDLLASIVELKEWAEDYAHRTNQFLSIRKLEKFSTTYLQEVAKRHVALKDMVEHCEAVLEKHNT